MPKKGEGYVHVDVLSSVYEPRIGLTGFSKSRILESTRIYKKVSTKVEFSFCPRFIRLVCDSCDSMKLSWDFRSRTHSGFTSFWATSKAKVQVFMSGGCSSLVWYGPDPARAPPGLQRPRCASTPIRVSSYNYKRVLKTKVKDKVHKFASCSTWHVWLYKNID